MRTKQIFLDDAKTNFLTVEWAEDFTSLRLMRNDQRIGEFLNKEDLLIGKSFKIENNLIFINLKKTLFGLPELHFLINGKDYDSQNNIYSEKLFGLSIVFQILAVLSIFNFFNFYSTGLYSIVSGLIYSGLGYVHFVERKYKLGFGISGLLFFDISFNIASHINEIHILHLPQEISMRIIMLLIIITSLIYASKEKKIKNGR
jgi:hypothetical protein